MAEDSTVAGRLAHSRWPAYVVGLGAVVAAALPAFGSAQHDAFPLSTYPMFARTIDKPELSFVERVDGKRHTRRLSPEHLGSDEVMQAYRTVKGAVRNGPKAAQALCRTLAKRVASREHNKREVHLRIVRARFDPVAYFVDDAEPEEREIIASCSSGRAR
jgi:hypothetical protein